MLIELMLVNAGAFFLILIVMLFMLAMKPGKHSKKKVKEDLKNIKDQINGDK
jgi:preprotein translocase subunit YajC